MSNFDLRKYLAENKLNEAALSDSFYDYYIANKDTTIGWRDANGKSEEKPIPAGTVIYARGGGYWKSIDNSITVGIESLKGNPDFTVVNNMTWPNTVDLTYDLEKWADNTNKLIQNDPDNIEQIIADRAKTIDNIRNMLK